MSHKIWNYIFSGFTRLLPLAKIAERVRNRMASLRAVNHFENP